MPRITGTPDVCTVIVTLDAPPERLPAFAAHAAMGLERFRRYDGFVAGALHLAADGGRLVQYLQWRSEAEYRACIEDPAWDALPSTRELLAAVASGEAMLDARTYRVAATGGDDP